MDRAMGPPALQFTDHGVAVGRHDGVLGRPRLRPEGLGRLVLPAVGPLEYLDAIGHTAISVPYTAVIPGHGYEQLDLEHAIVVADPPGFPEAAAIYESALDALTACTPSSEAVFPWSAVKSGRRANHHSVPEYPRGPACLD